VQQAGAVAYVVVVRHAAVHTALRLAEVGQHDIPQVGHLATQVPARTLHKHHAQSLHACYAIVSMCCTRDSGRAAPNGIPICMPGVNNLLPGVSWHILILYTALQVAAHHTRPGAYQQAPKTHQKRHLQRLVRAHDG